MSLVMKLLVIEELVKLTPLAIHLVLHQPPPVETILNPPLNRMYSGTLSTLRPPRLFTSSSVSRLPLVILNRIILLLTLRHPWITTLLPQLDSHVLSLLIDRVISQVQASHLDHQKCTTLATRQMRRFLKIFVTNFNAMTKGTFYSSPRHPSMFFLPPNEAHRSAIQRRTLRLKSDGD